MDRLHIFRLNVVKKTRVNVDSILSWVGLGVSDNDRNKTFIATIDNFNDVLSSLNKEHSSKGMAD